MIIEKILDQQMDTLPKEIFFCSKCVNSNQRPRLKFDEHRVCDACIHTERKKIGIDWKTRGEELRALMDKYRSKDGSYDVVVPGSGGKDSCYVAHQLKYEYKMHPLCVTWAPAMYTDIGWKNLQSFTTQFDTVIFFPNRQMHGKLSRLGLELLGDTFQPWHYGVFAYPIHIAVQYGIPLVVYGENQDVEYGGSKGKDFRPYRTVEDIHKLHAHRDPRGVDALVEEGLRYGVLTKEEVSGKQLDIYRLPALKEAERLGLQLHYYSYYKNWIPQYNYYYAQEHCGFEANPERTEGTYSKYSSIDDKIDGLHFYMQYIKFGFGRCTSEAAHEIRDGHITREEGVALVHKYDGEFPRKYFQDSLHYMGIDESHFWKTVDKFRPPHIWKKTKGEWQLRAIVQ